MAWEDRVLVMANNNIPVANIFRPKQTPPEALTLEQRTALCPQGFFPPPAHHEVVHLLEESRDVQIENTGLPAGALCGGTHGQRMA